jgi:hypothetical protein
MANMDSKANIKAKAKRRYVIGTVATTGGLRVLGKGGKDDSKG